MISRLIVLNIIVYNYRRSVCTCAAFDLHTIIVKIEFVQQLTYLYKVHVHVRFLQESCSFIWEFCKTSINHCVCTKKQTGASGNLSSYTLRPYLAYCDTFLTWRCLLTSPSCKYTARLLTEATDTTLEHPAAAFENKLIPWLNECSSWFGMFCFVQRVL